MAAAIGTRDDPWTLKTPPGSAEFSAWRDEESAPPALVVQAGKMQLRYHLRCIEDLRFMLSGFDRWMLLGGADENKPTTKGTVEDWARSKKNPVGGFYGLEPGLRGRFAVYVPPVLEALGLVELEHNAKANRVRIIRRDRVSGE